MGYVAERPYLGIVKEIKIRLTSKSKTTMEDVLGIALAIVVAGIILYLGVYGATGLLAVYDEIAEWLSRKKR